MREDLTIDRRWSATSPFFTKRDVAAVLFRRKRVFVISFAAILLTALLYALLFPSYQSQMKFLVRRGRLDPPMTPQPTGVSEYARYDVTEEELNSEIELLKDQDILRAVVLANRLEDNEAKWWNPDREVRVARAIRRLAAHLTVQPIRKTRLIVVRYRSSDAAHAGKVLRSLAAIYSEKHLAVHRPSGEYRFFEEKTEQYREGLEQAEEQLLQMIDDSSVVAGMQQREIALQRLSEADARYHETHLAIRDTGQRIKELEDQLVLLPERTTTEIRTSDNPQLMEKLKSTLLSLNLKRTELLTKFQPEYRLVQEVDQQIADTKALIEVETKAPIQELTTAKNANYEWADSELSKAKVELGALRARERASRDLLAVYQENARAMGKHAIEQQRLLRNAKAAEENYLLYRKKREEARIGDALDERGVVNVAMIEEPRAPALPQRSRLKISFLGFLAAFVLSTGAAFAADYAHPGFRTRAEVAELLGSPVLACLPRATPSLQEERS